jgi:hypothetical protein
LVCNGTNSCFLLPIGFPPVYIPTCIPGTAPDCDDQNACTIDSCGEPNGCQHIPVVCDDGNLCTQDVCDVQQGCLHVPVAGCCQTNTDCATDACTTGIQCVAHTCTAGTAKSCDDGNPCTTDACDPATGCTHTAVAACCQKDADCTATGDPCTSNTCNAAHACEEHPATGVGAIECACAQPSPSACNGEAVPASLTRRLTRGCALIGQAQSGGSTQQKLIAHAAGLFGRAAHVLAPGGGKGVSAACAAALKAEIGDVHGRAATVLDQL